MLSLPRGAFQGHENVRLASAEWASPVEAARFVYEGKGALFVGALPYHDAWPKLMEIRQHAVKIRQAIEASSYTPPQKAKALDRLDKLWLQAMGSDCLPVGLNDDRHAITIAGARSGKGQSAIIPNLCLYPGSVVCLDPKGENATLTAARRGQGDQWASGLGQAVYVFDPFGVAEVADELRASLNPLALLSAESPLVVDDAALLAEGLILPGGDDDGHWTETARNLVKGVILHLVSTRPGATLFDLRKALTTGDAEGFKAAQAARKEAEAAREDDPDSPDDPEAILPKSVRSAFMFLLWSMSENQAFDGVVAGTAESLLGTGENERGSILSTARRNTAFLDTLGPRYKATLSGDFRPLDPDHLKAAPEGVTVYLCLPAERMGTHGRWLRLMIGLFLERMQRQIIQPASGVPVLFLLEEFFSLGSMPAIEKAAGYAAGFGVKLWIILQDLQQIKSLYKTSWQTFLANAGMVQIFGASDRDTLDYASQALGEFEVSRETVALTRNTSTGESQGSDLARFGPAFGAGLKQALFQSGARGLLSDVSRSTNTADSQSVNVGLHVVPLLRPDEIALHFARETGGMLVLLKGQRPLWVLRTNYNEAPWFRGLFTPLARWRDQHEPHQHPAPLWERAPTFRPVVSALNDLASAFPPERSA